MSADPSDVDVVIAMDDNLDVAPLSGIFALSFRYLNHDNIVVRMASWRSITVVLVFALVLSGVGIRLWTPSATSETRPASPDGLVRITPHRIPMSAALSDLCYVPQPAGPHSSAAEVHIYANQIALDYRRDHPNGFDYPVNSKFVKEKYSNPDNDNPDVATIMERISAKGDVSDWRFSIVSLPDKTPLKASGNAACAECHQSYKDTGYVSADSELALRRHLKFE